jgi:hypothetical protein
MLREIGDPVSTRLVLPRFRRGSLTLGEENAGIKRDGAANRPEHPVVHMIFVLALFRFCSSYEGNTTHHHDISRHLENRR